MAMTKVVVALALVAAAWGDVLDREMYDDTPGDVELMYPFLPSINFTIQEQNYVDMMPEPEPEREQPTPPPFPKVRSTSHPRKYEENSLARRMLLYKMLMASRNHDASPSFLSVPKWIPTGTVLVPPDTFDYSHLRGPLGAMFKRSPGGGSSTGVNPNPGQQKWTIKKGKTDSRAHGSSVICYSKLCSFFTT